MSLSPFGTFLLVGFAILSNRILVEASGLTTDASNGNQTQIPPVLVKLSLNVTKVPLGSPFTATCSIWDFEATDETEYSVIFHNFDGILGTYSHRSQGEVHLSLQHSQSVTVHQGQLKEFPVFELQITQLVQEQPVFWCSFEVTAPKLKIESNRWPAEAKVTFTSSQTKVEGEHLGICQLSGFEPKGSTFEVKFYIGLQDVLEHLLGTYTVTPGQLAEFLSESVPNWSQLRDGPAASFPTFSILGTVAPSTFENWWCTLEMTPSGESEAERKVIKSNAVPID